MMRAMLRGNWTIKVRCHKLSLLLMIDLKRSFRCIQRQSKTNTRYLGHVFGYMKKPYCSRGFRILPKVNLKLWWIPQSSLVSKFETFSLFCDNDMRQRKGQKKVRLQTLAKKPCIFICICISIYIIYYRNISLNIDIFVFIHHIP